MALLHMSPDPYGHHHHSSEPMAMGSPASPHQSQYLPSFLLGDSFSHGVSPMPSRLWSSGGGSPPRSHRHSSLASPSVSQHGVTGTPSRLDSSLRNKEKVGAPPIRSLLQTSSPAHPSTNNSFSTPSQFPARSTGLSTPAPPTTGLSQSMLDVVPSTEPTPSFSTSRIPASPAQLDPFYTQGESLTTDDILDETWVTVYGFPPAAASFVLQQFSQYGNIVKHVISTDGNWMHLHYQSKIQAKKALSKNGKVIGNSIMIGVISCIDKRVMNLNKENDSYNNSAVTAGAVFSTPNSSGMAAPIPGSLKHTPIRPLTAAYKAAKGENEVVQNDQAPKKKSGFVSKAMEYMFGW